MARPPKLSSEQPRAQVPSSPAALTYHLLLHGLQRAGDGCGAAVGHISAQSFLYMAVQFLQPEDGAKRRSTLSQESLLGSQGQGDLRLASPCPPGDHGKLSEAWVSSSWPRGPDTDQQELNHRLWCHSVATRNECGPHTERLLLSDSRSCKP